MIVRVDREQHSRIGDKGKDMGRERSERVGKLDELWNRKSEKVGGGIL